MGKGENAAFQHFPSMFSKGFYLIIVETWGSMVKRLNVILIFSLYHLISDVKSIIVEKLGRKDFGILYQTFGFKGF